LLSGGAAAADTLSATRAQPLRELSHEVKLSLQDGVARYTVQRTFENRGTQHEEAALDIALPVGAAGTGLRIKAGDSWFDGELMRRERAFELYEKLTGFGPHLPKDPAILYWLWASGLKLQVFPIAPGRQSTVEYTLTAPTQYRDGRYFVSYPRAAAGGNLAVPELRLVRGDTPRLDGRPVAPGSALKLLRDDRKPSWFGDRTPDPAAGYASSVIDVREPGQVDKLSVSVDIRHTYRGDLQLHLVTPAGRWLELGSRGGGQKNDVRETFELQLPQPESAAGRWRLVVSDHAALDVGTLNSWSVGYTVGRRRLTDRAEDTPVFLPDAPRDGAKGQATISVAAPPIRTLAARLGRVPAARSKHFVRLEIDAAPQLRPLPKELSVVFVVDASHSVVDGGIEAQLGLARSFLRHVPDAHFEVVVFRRRAARLAGRFAKAEDIAPVLAGAQQAGALSPGNGSALDAGIELAVKALRRRPSPRMMVLTTDALLRPAWDNSAAYAALAKVPADTVVHLVIPTLGGGQPRDRRDDAHPLAPIAAKQGGVLLHISDLPGEREKDVDAITLGLVRPIRIDHFGVQGVAFDGLPEVLEEGDGIREMVLLAEQAPVEVTLTGKIWARPFRRPVRATLPFSRATAAFVFSHDLHHELSEEEQLRVARIGRAVSPVTSYLAIEPGVRPSRIGFARGVGYGSLGGSHRGRAAYMRVGSVKPDLKQLLAAGVQACLAQHRPAPGWQVRITVETTYDEVVDVTSGDKPSPLRDCFSEAAWALRLPALTAQRDSYPLAWP